MKKKIIFGLVAIIMVFSLTLLCACDAFNSSSTNSVSTNKSETISVQSTEDMFTQTDIDYSYDEDEVVSINLSNSGISTSSSSVEISSNNVIITNEGTYKITGSIENSTIIVDADNQKVHIILDDVNIINTSFACIYVKNADKVFVNIENNSTLKVTSSFVQIDDNKVDGVIYSKDDLTIQGSGSLEIVSSKHGIVCKDDLKIIDVNLTINASNHAIDANDSVRLYNANLTLISGKDGIHCENTDDTSKGFVYIEDCSLTINASGDGIDSSNTVQILNSQINITSGGGSSNSVSSSTSQKGIKSDLDMLIQNSTITINSCDDAIHSNSSLQIDSGEIDISSGDDGIHADISLVINGGTISISKSYEGLEAQNIAINGGDISVYASDDGLNAAGGNDSSSISSRPGMNNFNSNSNAFISITGGTVYVNSSGDGIDANGSISISGGIIIVEGPTDNGNAALDYDSSANITGGTILAIGSSGMSMNFSTATQGSILYNLSSSQNAGTHITIKDSSGNTIYSFTSTKRFSSILFSDANLKQSNSYTIQTGSTSKSITLSSLIYGSSSQGGMMPGGRR